jgi:peptide deformylase
MPNLYITLILLFRLPLSVQALLQYQRVLLVPAGKRWRTTSCNPPATSGNGATSSLFMRLNPTSFEGTRFTITEFPRPALRFVPNNPVENFDATLLVRAQEMILVMYQAKGVGLAAPQVGLNEMLFVYNPSGDPNSKSMERIVCNPTITEYSKETEIQEEACLSLRSDYCPGSVSRASWIQVQYQNELGQLIRRRLKGFEARVFQHEYDHLQGILCWDRFPPEDRKAVQANINKLLTLYPEKDARMDADPQQLQAMQPPPLLSAKKMPPLEKMEESGEPIDDDKTTPVVAKARKTGFGDPSGFGAGASSKKAKPKKKGKS